MTKSQKADKRWNYEREKKKKKKKIGANAQDVFIVVWLKPSLDSRCGFRPASKGKVFPLKRSNLVGQLYSFLGQITAFDCLVFLCQ